MPLFWNSIFGQSSYSELKIKIKKILELEFHVKYSSSTWIFSRNSSTSHGTWVPKKKNSKSTFAITRFIKNRVLHLKLDFYKIKFQNRDISLISLKYEAFYWKVCEKQAKAHFGPCSKKVLLYIVLSSFSFQSAIWFCFW